jgi:hypothetical protein
MMVELLLLANVLVFLALAFEAKIRSRIGFAIVLSGLTIASIDLLFIILSLLRVI